VKKIGHVVSVIVITILVIVFFWKVVFKGMVPFPGDLLVGSYYPWLEYKWGYIAGVPVKNGLISDVFSETYVWKHLVAESLKNGQWPLWNPYAYSGYPLMANFSSGALYFLNILFLFGIKGWNAMIIIQVLGTALAMYLFLTLKNYGKIASIGGAIALAFSASMMGRLEWNSAGHVVMWLAVTMALLEYFFERNRKIIILLPFCLFFLVTAGHFQTMIYSSLLIGLYSIYKLISKKETIYIYELGIFTLIGVAFSAIQLLPTFSMMNKSIRFSEGAVAKDNFGLLPAGNLITLIAPDYFGNPTTGNFWGFLNYSETIFYPGILGIIAFLWASFNYRKLSNFTKLMFFVVLFSVLLAFDNSIGRLVYQIKIPLLSTGYAARIAILLMFSSAVLSAEWLKNLSLMKTKEILLPFLVISSSIIIGFLILIYGKSVFNTDIGLMGHWLDNMSVAGRNLILPLLLVSTYFALTFFRKFRYLTVLIIIVLVIDLFRFGWKYNPFVVPQFVYPKTEVTDFLQKQPGLFRVAAQNGPILPATTWAMYGLSSASGYDPLISSDYALQFSELLNKSEAVSRYSILDRYSGSDLGEFNVKYLLIDKEFSPLGKTTIKSWDKVFETDKIAIYQNKEYKERIEWGGQGAGSVNLLKYSPNKIRLSYTANSNGQIIIRDSWDGGWKATVKGSQEIISKYKNIFRTVNVSSGSGEIDMEYLPDEWQMGKNIFGGGLVIWSIISLYIIKSKKHEQT